MRQVLENIGELAVCPPNNAQQDAGLIHDAAVVIEDQQIAWIGAASALPPAYHTSEKFDCGQRLVIPGLIDCHTHLCFGGWRDSEFEMRLGGRSYQDIQAAGGGIASTVKATRESSKEALHARARQFLDRMLQLGVTTIEAKSGYGLNVEDEIKQLEVYAALDQSHDIDIVPTVLGAHVVPPEYADDREAYLALLCEQLLPAVAERDLARFCDVFVEQGAYTVEEAQRILTRARELGIQPKVHADQLSDGGGAALAARVGAISADHLEYVSEAGMNALAAAETVAVSLPLASLYLSEPYLPARRLLQAGIRVAVATDFNPGSAPSYHLPLAMLLACVNQSMTPQESLMGVTVAAAKAVGLERSHGSLTPGYRADLVIIDAPSLNHWMYHFQDNACKAVMKSGRWAHQTL